jgi:ABC-type multidrug transport system fused ATPase/permease subunit
VRHCDRILVVDGGRIAEQGTYEELIEQGGLFAELVARQRLEGE